MPPTDSGGTGDGPHQGQPIARQGVSVREAEVAVVLCHGRGATTDGMIALAEELEHEGVAYLAPRASRRTWYPRSFLEPLEANEPWLSSALAFVGDVLEEIASEGLPADRVVLGGFSQGGCLATAFAARNARRYGGVFAFSGGLIGPKDADFDYEGSLGGTPVFLGCSDVDPHIPLERVHETRDVLEAMGADVDERIYEGMGHTVNQDEIDALEGMIGALLD
jgi:phospholipase/carboxylesterase